MRKKIQDLEDNMSRQNSNQMMLESKVENLEQSGRATEDGTGQMVKDLASQIRQQFADLKEEMDHKSSLQTAENKRLQRDISNRNSENQALERRVVALEKRVAGLEAELCGDDV